MPEQRITIGGRDYDIACQPGEEGFLQAAAQLLDREATILADQGARLPESRMLLMTGLMLADRTAGIDEQLRIAEARAADLEREVAALRATPAPAPERVEVPVIPTTVLDHLSELAARAEALADETERRAEGDVA